MTKTIIKNGIEWKVIDYPVSLNYRSHWDEWCCIRELVQNSLDETEGFKIKALKNGIVVSDLGEGIQVKHLLFGITEKKSEDARGRFGEGLKIALIVLKRLGYDIEIFSNHLHILVDTTKIEGEECLRLLYRETHNSTDGTLIKVVGYEGETYEDRFVSGNKKILFHSYTGDIIKETPKRLYVKDIYVQDLPNASYSYNLRKCKLEESRGIADQWELEWYSGFLMCKCDSIDVWVKCFKAIRDKKWETCMRLTSNIKHPKVVSRAFERVFGINAVLGTNALWIKEAEWRGADTIQCFSTEKHGSLFDTEGIQTDREFVLERDNAQKIIVKDEDLNHLEYRNLITARSLVERYCENWGLNIKCVNVYLLEKADGMWLKETREIAVNREALTDVVRTFDVIVHEVSHAHGFEDMTKGFILMLSKVAGRFMKLLHTSEFDYVAKVLKSRCGEYDMYRIRVPIHLVRAFDLEDVDKVRVKLQPE